MLVLAILFAFKDKRLLLALFGVIYLTLNLWVNVTDFLYTGLIKEYYHDEFFLMSFSYKIHQLFLCATLAFILNEMINTSVLIVDRPRLLSFIFSTSIAVSISLFITFSYELTWYTPLKRLKVFKTEVTKILMTIVYFNLITLLLMSWMW